MGSTDPAYTSTALPSSSSQDLLLTHPTPSERTATWKQTHALWGSALDEATYVKREAYLQTIPVAKAGGITNWILTTSPSNTPVSPGAERPVLSSCETLRKRALVSITHTDGRVELREGIAHGVGGVFTAPAFRGQGYASRMMSEVAAALHAPKGGSVDSSFPTSSPTTAGSASKPSPANGTANGVGKHPTSNPEGGGAGGERRGSQCLVNGCSGPGPSSLFSVLYSDIGKTFYARHGWAVFPSTHVAFPPTPSGAPASPSSQPAAMPLAVHDIAPLATLDEALLRAQLSRPSPTSTKRVRAALVPDLDTLLWHLLREDFMTSQLFARIPSVRGCLVGLEGRRVWAVWTRNYYSKALEAGKNTMFVLRFVIEDEVSMGMEELVAAFRAIMNMAQQEAKEWIVGRIDMWNPSPLVTEVIKRSGIECAWEDREANSIPSLMWYGEGSADDIEWVANEKYAWY